MISCCWMWSWYSCWRALTFHSRSSFGTCVRASGVTYLLYLHMCMVGVGVLGSLLHWVHLLRHMQGDREWPQLSWQPGHCACFSNFLLISWPHVFQGKWLYCPGELLCVLWDQRALTSLVFGAGRFLTVCRKHWGL